MDIKETREVYNDIWAYHKKYMDVRNDEGFLNSMIADRNILRKKYLGNRFAGEFLVVVFDSLMRTWTERFLP